MAPAPRHPSWIEDCTCLNKAPRPTPPADGSQHHRPPDDAGPTESHGFPPVSDLAVSEALVVHLDDDACLDPTLVGGKAAALAVAGRAGLPVLDAMVLTTAFTAAVDAGQPILGHPAVDQILDHFGEQVLVVRSSSTVEDQADSSMAGRFESVLGVTDAVGVAEATRIVLASRAAAAESPAGPAHPMAVLIQPFVEASTGGVLFGVEPVSGRSDRLAVAAADDPAQVVAGLVDGIRNELDLDGNRTDSGGSPNLPRGLRRELAALARRTAEVFGGPQDMEWLVDRHGGLRLLQSRPVTTVIRGVPVGPLYGPGPVAETFPDPLRTLERDLWVPPLREAMREALVLAGVASREAVERREIVVAPGGRVAVDLEITREALPRSRAIWARLDIRQGLSSVRTAWRIGRLRAALPDIAMDLIDRTDTELRGVVDPSELTDRQLVALLGRLQRALVSLHAHEILMGLVVDPAAPTITGASVALRVLGEARRDGRDSASIIADNPVVLALVPPRITGRVVLPKTPDHMPPADRARQPAGVAGLRREALRLRVRWVQELSARAAWEIGCRMTRAGQLHDPEEIVHMHIEDVRMVFLRWAPIAEIEQLPLDVEPLPGTFRLSDTGMPIRVRRSGVTDEAVGAGGGIGTGPVTHDTEDPAPGSVLVVSTLRPDLAPILGRLAGLVAETGSPLAHLAILAREAGIPTVVAVGDTATRFVDGTTVQVDGTSGRIVVVDQPPDPDHRVPLDHGPRADEGAVR